MAIEGNPFPSKETQLPGASVFFIWTLLANPQECSKPACQGAGRVIGRVRAPGSIACHCGPQGSCVLPQVVLVVDEVLETQDLNGDGLMTPAELVNFPGEAPRPSEHPEPPEPEDLGRQPPSAESPPAQAAQEALGPGGEEGQVEAGKEPLEPGQEAGETAPGLRGEAGAQAEARDAGKEAEELPGETLESKNPPSEFEVHAIQLENDEI